MLIASDHPDQAYQHTLKSIIHCTGVGLHSGKKLSMRLAPAEINSGIIFVRTDLRGGRAVIPGSWENAVETPLCTMVANEEGVSVGTIEHLMAALAGCGIDNVVVEIDGPELPIMDGSAEPFVFLIECAGISTQAALRQMIQILRPVSVGDTGRHASLQPADQSRFSFEIDFADTVVARQRASFTLSDGAFKTELCRARTFGFLHEVDELRRNGLARGGSLDNAIVINGDAILNEGGLRYRDEFVRHKILDSIGDLYLAGAPILGHFHGFRSGHATSCRLLQALFANPANWRWTDSEGGEALVPVSYPYQPTVARA